MLHVGRHDGVLVGPVEDVFGDLDVGPVDGPTVPCGAGGEGVGVLLLVGRGFGGTHEGHAVFGAGLGRGGRLGGPQRAGRRSFSSLCGCRS